MLTALYYLLKWEPSITSTIKKAQQMLYFLLYLRKLSLSQELLIQIYTSVIKSILYFNYSLTWQGPEKDKD